eukprot:5744481-Amphidinium_carterae.1
MVCRKLVLGTSAWECWATNAHEFLWYKVTPFKPFAVPRNSSLLGLKITKKQEAFRQSSKTNCALLLGSPVNVRRKA